MPFSQIPPRRIALSQQDLQAISQAISRDFSPRFFARRQRPGKNTQFSSQELREISRLISRDFTPTLQSEHSQLVLLPVSPSRLHAYWQIAKQRLLAIASTQSAQQSALETTAANLTLRVYPEPATPENRREDSPSLPTAISGEDCARPCFEISLADWQGQIDVPLSAPPPQGERRNQATRYHATLGLLDPAGHFVVLADSNPAQTPLTARRSADYATSPALMQSIMLAESSRSINSTSGQGK